MNRDKAEYLKRGLAAKGVRPAFSAPTFNEFTAVFPSGFRERYLRLAETGLVAGFPLERWYPELPPTTSSAPPRSTSARTSTP